jgi:hypothetical protein
LLERYRDHGPLSLVNRRCGQPGNWQLMPSLAECTLRINRERYFWHKGSNPHRMFVIMSDKELSRINVIP